MAIEFTDVILRLGAATLAGVVIGINREIVDKPMGMRTLALVALGAATVAVAAIDHRDLADHADALSRVVQGIVQGVMAGISFIGAGVILRNASEGSVEGLTTAATVWVVAAIGIACGLAAWGVVGVALVLALVVLAALGWIEARFWPKKKPEA